MWWLQDRERRDKRRDNTMNEKRLQRPAASPCRRRVGGERREGKKIRFGELTGVYLSDGCCCDAPFIQ